VRFASFLVLILTACTGIFAFAEAREGKAVFEISPETGMKMNEVALKNIEVQIRKSAGGEQQLLPKSALVFYQDKIGIYRLRDGWFKLVEVKVIRRDEKTATIQLKDSNSNDQIVISGGALMRVAEMDAFGGEE